MKLNLRTILAATVLLNAGLVVAQESVIMGGAGSMIQVAQGLAQAFEAKNPGAKIQVVPTTMGSTGGINAIASGKVTVALAARGLKAEESTKLKYHPLGRSAVVIAVNKAVPLSALTSSQVCDLFGGKYKSWHDVGAAEQKVDVLTRNEDDGSKESVRANIPCFKNLHPVCHGLFEK